MEQHRSLTNLQRERLELFASEDAPWIFLYNPIRYLGASRALGAWGPSPEGYITFS